MSRHGGRVSRVLIVAALIAVPASGQSAHETFTATASVTKGGAKASAPVTVTVTRYASADERAAAMKAVREGGTAGLRAALSAMKDAGFIQVGERRTPIKYAGARPTGSGRLVTVVTAEPMLFLGAGSPQAKPKSGFDVAVAMLHLKEGEGAGFGELALAAAVRLDEQGAFQIDDYGATVIWLEGLARSR